MNNLAYLGNVPRIMYTCVAFHLFHLCYTHKMAKSNKYTAQFKLTD